MPERKHQTEVVWYEGPSPKWRAQCLCGWRGYFCQAITRAAGEASAHQEAMMEVAA